MFFFLPQIIMFTCSTLDDLLTSSEVSITVTEPSPEQTQPGVNRISEGPSTLVHVLVHRESEEYQTDAEENDNNRGKMLFLVHLTFSMELKLYRVK